MSKKNCRAVSIAFYPYSQAVIVLMQARRLWLQVCTNITFDSSAP